MAHHQHHRRDPAMTTAISTTLINNVSSSQPQHLSEEEVALDVDEPPDSSGAMTFKRQPIRSPRASMLINPFDAMESRKISLLTEGLSNEANATPRPRSLISSLSSTSTAELTSDGGLTSPARTSTPSPPFPPTFNLTLPSLHKEPGTTLLASAEVPRKRCITFACGKPAQKAEEVKKVESEVKKPCTIKFACPMRPKEIEQKPLSKAALIDDSTPKKMASKASFTKTSPIKEKKRQAEALRFHEFATANREDEEWVYEKPRRQSKLTITDTLRKENEYRKMGEEAAAEARQAELEEDEKALNAEDDEDDNDDDDDLDEEIDTDGNESDNEEGFADSDDESVGSDSDYQFWTYHTNTAATSTEHIMAPVPQRLQTRSASASSIESVLLHDSGRRFPPGRKSRKAIKMRPSTPELPDSTDFVCGTLDEDRPLEAAYLACRAQKKAAKQAVIPQDLDPTFPTSDAEIESDVEDQESVGSNDFFGGHFDGFDIKRPKNKSKGKTRSPSMSPKRDKSPCPMNRGRVLAHTPPPANRLFGQSPRRRCSPAPRAHPASPPASRHPSYDDRSMEIPLLAQRPNTTLTKSLPRTPNPFWKAHCQQRKKLAAMADDDEGHSRGPIDIVQGLEDKRRRRKEKYWLTHCRKDAKEKEKERRRHLPGRGAKRMRELGLEAADRCKGYGQRLPLVLSI